MTDTTFGLEFDIDKVDFKTIGDGKKPVDGGIVAPNDRRAQQVRSTMTQAVKANPDQVSENTRLSEASGIPEWAIKSNPEQVQQFVDSQKTDYDQLSQNSPNTAKFFSDYENASVAHDDVPVLEKLESVFNVVRGLASGPFQAIGMGVEGLGETALSIDRVAAGNKEFEDRSYGDNVRLIAGALLNYTGQKIRDTAEDIAPDPEDQNFVTDVAAGVGQMGGQVVMHLVAPFVTLPMLFGTGVSLQADRQEETGTKGQDLLAEAALLGGGIATGASERMGLDLILNRIPPAIKNKVARAVIDVVLAGGIEAVQEVVENISQSFIEQQTTNPDAPLLEGIGNEAAVAGSVGAIVRGIILTAIPGKGGGVPQRLSSDAEIAQSQVEVEQNQIDEINRLATDSKLKQRNPSKFYQFVQQNDGDSNTQVYLNADKVAEYLVDQEISSDGALILLKESLDQTIAGEDVAVPVAAFATVIAGTTHFEALRGSMTLSEGSLSPESQEQARVTAQEHIEQLVTEAQENVSEYVQAQEIYEEVRTQLVDSGQVQPQNAAAMAQLVPAWATVFAKENGVTIQEAYEQSGLTIVGPQTGVKEDLDQQKSLLQKTKEFFTDFNEPTENMIPLDLTRSLSEQEVPEATIKKIEKQFSEDDLQLLSDEANADIRDLTGSELQQFFSTVLSEGSLSVQKETTGDPKEDAIRAMRKLGVFIPIDDAFFQSAVPTATVRDLAAKFDQEVLDKHGKRLDAKTPENKEIISDQLVEETIAAVGEGSNAAQWYKQSIASAMEFAAQMHPELATDANAMTVFKVIMAITSNGASVQENSRNAEFTYNKYKETGRIPEEGFGKEAGAMVKGFKRFNELVEMMGLENVQEFLNTPRTVKELAEMGFNLNGENVDQTVPTSAVFGPKVGIFFQNLVGNFNHVTMDRWFMRTWGRMTGTQVPVFEKAFPERAAKLRETIKGLPVKGLFGFKRPQLMKNDESLMEFAQIYHGRYTASKFKDKSDVNKQSKNLVEGVTAPIIDPKNGGNRVWMREVMKETQQKLADKGQDLDLATIQALLWYAEKDLYINNGIRAARVEATDYEQEFRKLADQRLERPASTVGEGRPAGATRPSGEPAFEQRSDIEDDKSARGYFNPDNSVIRLAEASDLSTFLHEFAHFMYEQELKAGSKNATDIGKWFKGNAVEVANEANGYLESKVAGDLQQPQDTPHQLARDVAKRYAEKAGLKYEDNVEHAVLDRDRAARIAVEYENMEHDPQNPEVKAAYAAMIEETIAQYEEVLASGLQIDFIRGEDPYAKTPRLAIEDVVKNNHLYVYSTREGFGSDEQVDVSDNPLLAETDFEISGEKILVNDIFRVVHDYFGHVKNGNGFRAQGEENAWQSHATMYSPLALRAMTSETRGQNSWVNFGPHGEKNRTATAADTVYADQKTGLMPLWVSEEGKVNDKKKADTTGRDKGGKLTRPPVVGGQIILEHYSKKQGLENLDPEFYGSNYAGRERDRSSEPNWQNRTLYGIETGKKGGYVKEYGVGNHEYIVSVPAERMYDGNANPDGLDKTKGLTNYEAAIKEAGYLGFWSINGRMGMVAGVFETLTPLRQDTEIPQGQTGRITEDDVNQFIDQASTGDVDKDAALRRATHEQFARGFEAYLMEGKAPSVELRNVFRTFARWLAEVYKRIQGNLNINLTDDMRAVFDRMLATEEQLDMARAREQVQPLFTDATMAGMTDAAFVEYQKNVSTAKDVESETLREKVIKELTRQTKSWWKEEKADMVVEETARLREEKVYRAITALRSTDLKIDKGVVRELLGEERVDKRGIKSVRIPERLNGMLAAGADSVHPDEAAAFLEYNSGDEMLTDIIESAPIKQAAEAAAEARMLETHGDILNDGTIEQQATEALQNEERGKLLLRELKQINKTAGAPTLARQAIKQLAEENIGKLAFRQIQPGKYQKAKEIAGKEAAVAQAQGDMAAASRAKSREILNFYLAKAATDARNNTLKIVDRMKRYNKKSVREEIMKAENGYWEQLVKILSRFEFRKSATLTAVDQKNESLNVWMSQMMELEGDGLVLSPEVLDEAYQTHWKNVPYDSLLGINESVKNIEHVARYATKMDLYGEEIAFEQLVQRWDTHLNTVAKDKFVPQRTDATKGRNTGRWAMAQMSKIPWMASWLDGGERAGMSHEILMSGLNEALFNEIEMMGAVTGVVTDAISDRSRAAVKRGMTKFFIPEIKDDKNDGNLMGNQIIAVALNTGNQSNLRKMLLGEGWANKEDDTTITIDNPQLQAVLAEMTGEEWDLVELIWQQMDLLYPQLAEVHRKTTGLVPPKVQEQSFSIDVDGEQRTLKGGYYPVKYDPARSDVARKNEEDAAARVDSMFSTTGSIQSSVNASSTNERTGFYAPVLLDLSIVPNHFQETIHFITHHDAVRQLNKLIRNKTISNTISRKLGPEEFAELKPWLNDIAKLGSAAPTKTFIDSVFQKLRFGVTLGVMGFKVTTGLMQTLGLANSTAEVGLGNMMQAFGAIMGSPKTIQEAWTFANENSKVLKHRTTTMDREIGNAMKQLEGKRGAIAAVQEASMKHIALIQIYSVDLPSWYAAYIKEMKLSGDEKKAFAYADWLIENVQGSGATKDMARIMRNQSKTHTTFTMFMTFFSSLWNQQRDTARSAKSGLDTPTTIAAKAAFIIVVPVILEMLMRGEFGGDDDEDEVYRKTLTRLALYPFASIPFVRDAASGIAGEYGYNMTPVASVLEQGLTRIPSVVEALVTDEELTKGEIKAVSKLVGASLGVPGVNQAWATGEHLYEVLEEGEDLTARQLSFGPTRE